MPIDEIGDIAKKIENTPLAFDIYCIHDRRIFRYDLRGRAEFSKCLTQAFSWVIFGSKCNIGHKTRCAYISGLTTLLRFFHATASTPPENIINLRSETVVHFSKWLEKGSGYGPNTARNRLKSVLTVLRQLKFAGALHSTFSIPKRCFRRSEQLELSSAGYSEREYRNIVAAVTLALRESHARLEQRYKPQWLGEPPPLEGVLLGQGTSVWQSIEHTIWWWKHNAGRRKLSAAQIKNIPGGYRFLIGISRYHYPGIPPSNALEKFYAEHWHSSCCGSEDCPISSPIKYRNRWQKFDYLHWHWENHLGCSDIQQSNPLKKQSGFFHGIKKIGGISEFYKRIGFRLEITADDLVPYYLMLLIRTGLNPSTLLRLTTSCLVDDPLDPSRKMIEWIKVRANTQGRTIPHLIQKDTWPAALISRVVELTAVIRSDGDTRLWITSRRKGDDQFTLTQKRMEQAVRRFSERYLSTAADNGGQLSFEGRRVRTTIASLEYFRTADLAYVQALLGHTNFRQTAQYIAKSGDPLLRKRRGIHQEAMFISLRDQAAETLGPARNAIVPEMNPDPRFHEALMNHCRDPYHPPIRSATGEICSAGPNACLCCRNLVVTPYDIKKFFCSTWYYDYLVTCGEASPERYAAEISPLVSFWHSYILPNFPPDLVRACESSARNDPMPEWAVNRVDDTNDQ